MQGISSRRAAWALPMALAVLAVALIAGPPAQAHDKSWKHDRDGKSGHSHKKHRDRDNGGTVSLAGGNTKLFVDEDTGDALESLGVRVEPVGPATYGSYGGFQFPITGGEVNARTLAGEIRHSGGLALVAGSVRVELTDFNVEIGKRAVLTASVGGTRVPILALKLSDLKRKDENGTVRLSRIRAYLTEEAAGALNGAFGTDALYEGLLIGTARVTAKVG